MHLAEFLLASTAVVEATEPSIVGNLVTLVLLVLLQAVLGFDNLLYISLESRRAPAAKQASVRMWGIGIAIVFRIVLLLTLMRVIDLFQNPLFGIDLPFLSGEFNLETLIVLAGGGFIIYTATKEIWHMMQLDHGTHAETAPKSMLSVVSWIVLMNLVFSFDSILSAMALSEVFWVMACAIVIGGILMIWLSDHVARFLQRNRTYEVLGLFVLFVVGIMLLTEGGHHARLTFFGNEVTVMSKTTFYFVLGVLVLTDVVQSRYQRKLSMKAAVREDTDRDFKAAF